jgi:hypothetical protein
MKHLAGRGQTRSSGRDLQRRLVSALVYYAYLRPRMSFDGATPTEVFFRVRPAHLDAHDPPRCLARSTDVDPVFDSAQCVR